jgi:hypothetical protein
MLSPASGNNHPSLLHFDSAGKCRQRAGANREMVTLKTGCHGSAWKAPNEEEWGLPTEPGAGAATSQGHMATTANYEHCEQGPFQVNHLTTSLLFLSACLHFT